MCLRIHVYVRVCVCFFLFRSIFTYEVYDKRVPDTGWRAETKAI